MDQEAFAVFLIVSILISIGIFIYFEEVDETNWCEIYAEQKVTSMRVPEIVGERQYALNGTWVNESVLKQSCLDN